MDKALVPPMQALGVTGFVLSPVRGGTGFVVSPVTPPKCRILETADPRHRMQCIRRGNDDDNRHACTTVCLWEKTATLASQWCHCCRCFPFTRAGNGGIQEGPSRIPPVWAKLEGPTQRRSRAVRAAWLWREWGGDHNGRYRVNTGFVHDR